MGNLPLNLLTFPLWWYTTGWKLLLDWNRRQRDLGLRQTGLLLFWRHMREPLYGDYTRSGLILGMFFRAILLLIKLLLFCLRLILLTVADVVYLAFLPVVLAVIIFQLIPPRP